MVYIVKDKRILTILNRLYYKYRHRTIKRDMQFSLTLEQFAIIITRPCIYCGTVGSITPTDTARWKDLKVFQGFDWSCNTIDRINNNLGYVLDNVQACCYTCNQLKSTLSDEAFINQVYKIVAHLGLGFIKDEKS